MATELHLFAHATNWKTYWSSFVREHLRGVVLEVGAGIGTNTLLLRNQQQDRWMCVEPDHNLLSSLESNINQLPKDNACEIITGTVQDLTPGDLYDSIIYIDVIEHIEDDGAELERVCKLLKPAGKLIILVPAHNWLYSPFDAEIGHFRRYNKAMLKRAIPSRMNMHLLIYLDSVGVFASLANRLLLRSPVPTSQQIQVWDKRLVPISKVLDPIFGYAIGKSILGVWTMNA